MREGEKITSIPMLKSLNLQCLKMSNNTNVDHYLVNSLIIGDSRMFLLWYVSYETCWFLWVWTTECSDGENRKYICRRNLEDTVNTVVSVHSQHFFWRDLSSVICLIIVLRSPLEKPSFRNYVGEQSLHYGHPLIDKR